MAEHEDRDQRTESATPRRREEARERGQVALSSELVAAAGLCTGIVTLALAGAPLAYGTGELVTDTLRTLASAGRAELSLPLAARILRDSLASVGGLLALVVLPPLVASGLAAYVQVGLRFAPKAVELDPSKVSPVRGMRRLFSARAVVRAALAAAKVLTITGAVVAVAWWHLPDLTLASGSELGPLLPVAGRIALRCTVAALAAVLALSLCDLAFQRFQHERDLRMSRREVREEQRLAEGDPHVRARVRQIQREIASRRMMADVPRATVVVTNPTHYAVALRYEREEDAGERAPRVVAKGKDHLARRIREIASRSGVVCREDAPLARALHARTEVGGQVPEDLFAAVAVVIAHVYRLRAAGAPSAEPEAVA